MPRVAGQLVNQDTELHVAQRVLIGVAAFWSRFWWLAWPFVIGAVFSFVGLIAILRESMAHSEMCLIQTGVNASFTVAAREETSKSISLMNTLTSATILP